ncbi:MAG: hypothetical protein KGI70_03615, partial [Patescibacteria group bacterium]|nr:hypothetical protein [Patescibacteria group bacterium]
MDLPFDTTSEDAKLAEIRRREEEDVARILSSKYGTQYADLSMVQIDAEALRTIPEKEARAAEAAAFAKNAHALSLALRNPNTPAFAKLQQELQARG